MLKATQKANVSSKQENEAVAQGLSSNVGSWRVCTSEQEVNYNFQQALSRF
jgi:hypothetical protein